MLKAKQNIGVLDTNGQLIKKIKRAPISANGFDSFKYNGAIYPAYWNGHICDEHNIQGFIKVYGEKAPGIV